MIRFIFILSIFYIVGDINGVAKTAIPYDIKETAELCRIGQNFFKQTIQPIPSCEQFQSPSLLKLGNTEFSIQNNSILFNGKLENCLQSLKQLNKEIRSKQNQTGKFVTLNYDGSSYIFQTAPLGEGERGIVYPLKHKNHVIKISKNDLKSMRILQEEKISSDFWYKISKDPSINFSVPQKVKEHPLGFFSVMERIDGQTLTEVLIRFNIVSIDKQHKSASLNQPKSHSLNQTNSLKKIELAIMDLVQIFRNKPEYKLSISPNNLLLTFSDNKKEQVDKVYLIDFGLDSGYHTNYEETRDFEHYLATARRKIEGYLSRYPKQFIL